MTSMGSQIGFVTCFEIYDQAIMITFTSNGNRDLNKSDLLMKV